MIKISITKHLLNKIYFKKDFEFSWKISCVFSWIKPGCENMFNSVSLCEQATVNSFLREYLRILILYVNYVENIL